MNLQLKAKSLNNFAHNGITRFYRVLHWHIAEVVQQGSKINPNTSGFKNLVYSLDKLYDVVRAIDEETCCHTVPVIVVRVHLAELDETLYYSHNLTTPKS